MSAYKSILARYRIDTASPVKKQARVAIDAMYEGYRLNNIITRKDCIRLLKPHLTKALRTEISDLHYLWDEQHLTSNQHYNDIDEVVVKLNQMDEGVGMYVLKATALIIWSIN